MLKTILILSLLIASFNAQSAVTACPSGWTKSADGLTCVFEEKKVETPNKSSNNAKPVCISGFTYSSTSMKCEQINNASTYNSNKTYTYMGALRFGPDPQEQCLSGFSNPKELFTGTYCFSNNYFKGSQIFYGYDYTATPYHCHELTFPYSTDWGFYSGDYGWYSPVYLNGGLISLPINYYNAKSHDNTVVGFSTYTNWYAEYDIIIDSAGYYTFEGVADDEAYLYVNYELTKYFNWNIFHTMYLNPGKYKFTFKIINKCPECNLVSNPTSLNVVFRKDSNIYFSTYNRGWYVKMVDSMNTKCYALVKVK
jgi:hypothetical protein